jgi:cytochrome c biogenesis factor
LIRAETTSRPEAAFVLLLVQSLCWLIAGISAAPFALAGEPFMAALSILTMLFALATCLVGIGVVWRRRRARAIAIAIEVLCLAGAALLLLLPIGANNGPVSLLINVALPVAVIVLLRKGADAFS